MPAYVIVEIDVVDPAPYEEYRRQTPATIAAYGGRFLVRGGPVKALEGGWEPARLVVLEFRSAERAEAWLSSPEYGAIKGLRQAAAKSKMVLVEGYTPAD